MFTANDVKTLREMTGCGMMDCKNALKETQGDLKKAVIHLREKGLAAAAKKSSRVAAEGLVDAFVKKDAGVLLEVNSETDFVSRNENFKKFVRDVAAQIIEKAPSNVEELLKQQFFVDDNNRTVGEALNESILIIGEKLSIRRFERYQGVCSAYIHGDGRIGVLVEFKVSDVKILNDLEFIELGKITGMQIAAANAQYVNRAEIPIEVLETEKNVIKTQALNEGKPETIIDKIISGRLEKYYKEICLMDQPFIKEQTMSFAEYIKSVAMKLDAGAIEIIRFARYERGEGIQKREIDFATEVTKLAEESL